MTDQEEILSAKVTVLRHTKIIWSCASCGHYHDGFILLGNPPETSVCEQCRKLNKLVERG